MSKDWLEGNWKQLKGEIRQRWSKLTDVDLDQIKGSREKLSGQLQEKYGYAKLEAEKAINELKTHLVHMKKH